MAEKESKKLTIAQRFILLNILPNEGDYATLKILRKLRETLAPDEKENESYAFTNEFRCPHTRYDEEGDAIQCAFTVISPIAPKCPIHNEFCNSTGKILWKPELAKKTKEVWFGKTAKSIIVETLERLANDKQLREDDGTMHLYEMFVGSEEEEE